jgi:hypothetical protein
MVTVVGGAVIARGQTASKASITAGVDRLLYLEGETAVLRGQVAGAEVKTVSVSAPVGQPCPVQDDGSFELKFPVPTPAGLHTLELTAEGVLPARVSFCVTSKERVTFPKYFDTDRGYEFGIFCDHPGDKIDLLPRWAWRLGFDFVAIRAGNGFAPNAKLETALATSDWLKMTAALAGGDDCSDLAGLAKTVQTDGSPHSKFNNLLSPAYQQALQTRLTELASSLRGHESFRYILLIPEQLNLSPSEGYDAENLARFAQILREADPKRKVPSPGDAAGWYKLLRADKELWGKWLAFRQRLWTDSIVKLREALQAIKPDLELALYGKAPDQGLWDLKKLADRGVTLHAPQAAEGEPSAMSAAVEDYKSFGTEPIFLGLPVRFDVAQEFRVPMSNLLGATKRGGTQTFVWSDYGLPAENGFYSVVTDEPFNRSTWPKVQPLFNAATQFQLVDLPCKDRFAAYKRDGVKLPVEFSIDWVEDGRALSVKSEDGMTVGKPSDPVFAVVQDIQPSGYMEILIFNGAAEKDDTAAGLCARTLNVTVRPGGGLIPFVSDAATDPLAGKRRLPWLVYERRDDAITVKSIEFKPQQVTFLQLVPFGRDLPHITHSPVGVVYTDVSCSQVISPQAQQVEEKYRGKPCRTLTVRLAEDPGREKVTVHGAGWGEPRTYNNCDVGSYDPKTNLAQLSEKGQRSDFIFGLFWPQ